jgi:NDP-sugar pyrophosphorylase family protein
MSFKERLREEESDEEISRTSAVILVGGEANRMSNVEILAFLPKPFIQINNTTLCLKNFDHLRKVGIKNFYIVTQKESKAEEIKEYFERVARNRGESYNIQILTKQNLFEKKESEKINIFIIANKATIIQQLVFLKQLLSDPFLVIAGDVYFDFEDEKELKRVIKNGLKMLKEGKGVMFDVLIQKEKQLGRIDWGERYFKLNENKKIISCSKEESLVFASISLISFRFFEFSNKVNASTLHDKQLLDFFAKEKIWCGDIMNVRRAVNVNYDEDLEKVKGIEKEKSKSTKNLIKE